MGVELIVGTYQLSIVHFPLFSGGRDYSPLFPLFGCGCGFGLEEDDGVVVEVDELLGGFLDVLSLDGFDNLLVAVHDVVAALVEAIAAHDLAHPEAVVLLGVLTVDDLLFLDFGEGLGIGAFFDVFLQDFHSGGFDNVGLVGVAVDVELPFNLMLGEAAVVDRDGGAVGAAHLLADDFEGGNLHAGAELVDDLGVLGGVLVALGAAVDEHDALVVGAFAYGFAVDAGSELGRYVLPVLVLLLAIARKCVEVLSDELYVSVGDVTNEEEGLVAGVVEALLYAGSRRVPGIRPHQ